MLEQEPSRLALRSLSHSLKRFSLKPVSVRADAEGEGFLILIGDPMAFGTKKPPKPAPVPLTTEQKIVDTRPSPRTC